ncbi:hypothetical protein [Candidatus Nitrospira neomarina]|uniref:Uncharacterized protein n=1 Tax=Candidatus Nitrospira neomarina TaxID=3020899 RepID=A0AA96GHA9_9BACT|nr:hypothetical protein [Candidatus Nitrospira neomarina]WNM61252.1 hypothetical protein PQG83_16045 [Candidatus Nitrospira neomarina]
MPVGFEAAFTTFFFVVLFFNTAFLADAPFEEVGLAFVATVFLELTVFLPDVSFGEAFFFFIAALVFLAFFVAAFFIFVEGFLEGGVEATRRTDFF